MRWIESVNERWIEGVNERWIEGVNKVSSGRAWTGANDEARPSEERRRVCKA
jgi:hypothetical protein